MNNVFINQKQNWIFFIVVLLITVLCTLSSFTLHESEQSSAFAFGQQKRDYLNAGLHFKGPWENIIKVDKRLMLHTANATTYKDLKKKNLLIDHFCLFQIDSPKKFLLAITDLGKAYHRMDDNLTSDIAAVIGNNISEDIVTNNRQQHLDKIKGMSNKGIVDIGISIRFLSFNRVELPNENKPAMFADMIADRNKISGAYTAEGDRIYDSITSNADFLANDILAKAKYEASRIMGSADSLRLSKLNIAYSKSKPLFKIYNQIQTYESVYKNKTEWVMSPDNLIALPNVK